MPRTGLKRNYVSLLALLQIGSLICLPVIVILLATLFRHQTEGVFLPLWDYIFSFRIAFPPVVIFVLGYLLAFLTGVSISEAPKAVVRYFRNHFLQSLRTMVLGICGTVVLCGWGSWFVSTNAPPHYRELAKKILRGESDDFASARKAIEAVQKKNSDLGSKYSLAMEVFAERARINLQAGQASTPRARLLVRGLSAERGSDWMDHPLRRHALAEAYSLLASGIRQRELDEKESSAFGDFSSDALFEKSMKLYGEVARSKDPLAVPHMRASALINLGNAHYYRNDYEAALRAWREANSEKLGFRNTSTWGNIVAGLIVTRQYDDAILEGEAARKWAETNGKALQETSQFVSIIVNTAFARLAKGNVDGALSDFQLADALQEDPNTKLNLALAYVLSADLDRAQATLRAVAPPVDRYTQAAAATSSLEKRCAQLIWFLAEPGAGAADGAARLQVFRGQAFSSTELNHIGANGLRELRREVASWLPNFPGACASLSHFEAVVQAIRGD